jgi:radical SAM protein with 4Fe4S-binding SPASM domain
VPHLIFTGGEATLRSDLPEIVAHADAAGPICGLNTNGRRLARRQYVDELAAAGLSHVQVTLGSHDPQVHDRLMNARSFDQTVRGIENALASPLHVITNTTLTRLNAGAVPETIAFLHALGIRTFALNALIHSGGGFDNEAALAEDELAPILVRARDAARERDMKLLWYTPTEYCRLSPVELELGAKRCNAGEYSVCVEPDGSVLPCQSFYVAAGNLLTDPWESIWKGELFRSFRERGDDPAFGQLPDKCHGCPDLALCGGGCRIQREAEAGVRVADAGCASGACGGAAPGAAGRPAGFVALDDLVTTARTAREPARARPDRPAAPARRDGVAGRARRATGRFR